MHIETINTLYKQLHKHTKDIYGMAVWMRPPLTDEQKKERDARFGKYKKDKRPKNHGRNSQEWQP